MTGTIGKVIEILAKVTISLLMDELELFGIVLSTFSRDLIEYLLFNFYTVS